MNKPVSAILALKKMVFFRFLIATMLRCETEKHLYGNSMNLEVNQSVIDPAIFF